MSTDKKNWYAIYTKPRWEKKVLGLLTEKGMEAYCPLNKVHKKWSDRVKWVEEPLFKSYVFVKVREEEQMKVRMVSGVVNFIYWLGKPAIVKDKEIEIIRKFLNDHNEVQAFPMDLQINSRITIRNGALMDKEARIMKVFNNNKVQVMIESIGFSLVAIIDKTNAEILKK
jgi:transcription antitermination factor NusG